MARRKPAESNHSMVAQPNRDAVPRGGKQGALVAAELDKIRRKNANKKLLADDVVYYAQDEDNPLHKYFTWDDDEAAHRYRLHEAHKLIIKVNLIVPKRGHPMAVRAFVRSEESGYDTVEEVMASPTARKRLLRTAFNDIQRMREKYEMLEELTPLWRSIDRLEKQVDTSDDKPQRKTG